MTHYEWKLVVIAAWVTGCVLSACAGRPHERDPVYAGRVSSRDVERGRGRYDVVCAPCHADHNDARAPLFRDIRMNAAAIRHQVREGDDQMPAIHVRRLSAVDLEALLAFLQNIGTCLPDPPDVAVEAAAP